MARLCPGYRTFIFLILLITSGLAQGQYCRWEDEKGTVHYTQECPGDGEGTELQLEDEPSQQRYEDAVSRSENTRQLLEDSKPKTDQDTGQTYPEPRPSTQRPMSMTAAEVKCPRSRVIQYIEKMEYRCEVARERQIKPMREKEIDECVSQQGNDRRSCEQYWNDYLNPDYVGRREERAFDYLPDCVIARECRKRAGLDDQYRFPISRD